MGQGGGWVGRRVQVRETNEKPTPIPIPNSYPLKWRLSGSAETQFPRRKGEVQGCKGAWKPREWESLFGPHSTRHSRRFWRPNFGRHTVFFVAPILTPRRHWSWTPVGTN